MPAPGVNFNIHGPVRRAISQLGTGTPGRSGEETLLRILRFNFEEPWFRDLFPQAFGEGGAVSQGNFQVTFPKIRKLFQSGQLKKSKYSNYLQSLGSTAGKKWATNPPDGGGGGGDGGGGGGGGGGGAAAGGYPGMDWLANRFFGSGIPYDLPNPNDFQDYYPMAGFAQGFQPWNPISYSIDPALQAQGQTFSPGNWMNPVPQEYPVPPRTFPNIDNSQNWGTYPGLGPGMNPMDPEVRPPRNVLPRGGETPPPGPPAGPPPPGPPPGPPPPGGGGSGGGGTPGPPPLPLPMSGQGQGGAPGGGGMPPWMMPPGGGGMPPGGGTGMPPGGGGAPPGMGMGMPPGQGGGMGQMIEMAQMANGMFGPAASPYMGGPGQGQGYPQQMMMPQPGRPSPGPQGAGPQSIWDVYNSAIPVMDSNRDRQIGQSMAQAGLGGTRFGTASANNAARIGADTALEQDQLLTQLMYNQGQSDDNRALQATQQGIQLGQLTDQLQRQRWQDLFGMGQWEQGRGDQMTMMPYQDFMQSRNGYLDQAMQMVGGVGTPIQPPPTTTQTAGGPGMMDWLIPLASAGIMAAGMSDERLKVNIQRLEDEAIPGVPWATWRWKSNLRDGFGVIAQDLEKIRPDLVGKTGDGYKTVYYGKLWEVAHGGRKAA